MAHIAISCKLCPLKP